MSRHQADKVKELLDKVDELTADFIYNVAVTDHLTAWMPIQQGTDPNFQDESGETPLTLAAQTDDTVGGFCMLTVDSNGF